MSRAEDILTFWFGQPRDDKAYYDEWHARWFTPDPQFDQEITNRFATDYQRAAERKLMEGQDTPRGGLALVLLLDQFPRNMFRGDPRAFATDPLARAVADHLIQAGLDRHLLPVERLFVYLPFMHSEDLADQQRSVALFRHLAQERDYLDSLSYALNHQQIIERFGRFPHRNAVLGRPSTPAEVEFLQQPTAICICVSRGDPCDRPRIESCRAKTSFAPTRERTHASENRCSSSFSPPIPQE